jgi:uncharacterized membrane protein (DUF485 family)
MTQTHGGDAERVAARAGGEEAAGASHHPEIDWIAAERSPEFRELVRRRKGFVIPATVFFLAWYFGFIVLAGYAPDFMGEEFLVDGLTVGYVLALTQFVMTWVLGWMYLRRSDRVFDPLARRAAEQALRAGVGEQRAARRFDRPVAEEQAPRSGEVTGR